MGKKLGLESLPDQFARGPHTEAFTRYINQKYTTYGRKGYEIAYNPEWKPEGTTAARYRIVEYPSPGLRLVGKAGEINGDKNGNYFRALDHTGWYTDNWQDEKVCGLVYQLPGRDGKPRYIPAIEDPCNDAAILDFHGVTGELRDAIRWADQMAESYAEREREYHAKQAAEDQIENIADYLKTKRAELIALVRELKTTQGINPDGAVCKALRAHVATVRASIRKKIARRKALRENYWEAVPQ